LNPERRGCHATVDEAAGALPNSQPVGEAYRRPKGHTQQAVAQRDRKDGATY
jgi:hypothetical protein